MEIFDSPGWWTSEWFGNYYKGTETRWILHEELGWLFPVPSASGGIWLWKDGIGWLWTDGSTYPFMHSHASGGWTFFFGQREDVQLFYDYLLVKWIVVGETVEPEGEHIEAMNEEGGQ